MNIFALYNAHIARAYALFAAVCAISVFMYGVFLLMAISHAAKLSSIKQESKELTSKVGLLESKYYTYTKELTPERAQSLGFVTPQDIARVYTSSLSGLSLAGEVPHR
jgi:hypothetical protein